MPLVSALLVGTVMGVCVLGSTLLGLVRNNRNKGVKLDGRKCSHVTEVLQVDMVDKKIRMTSIDCSLDMERVLVEPSREDQVLQPIAGFAQTLVLWCFKMNKEYKKEPNYASDNIPETWNYLVRVFSLSLYILYLSFTPSLYVSFFISLSLSIFMSLYVSLSLSIISIWITDCLAIIIDIFNRNCILDTQCLKLVPR